MDQRELDARIVEDARAAGLSYAELRERLAAARGPEAPVCEAVADGPIEPVCSPEESLAWMRCEFEQIPVLLDSRIEGAPWNRPDDPSVRPLAS